MNNKKSLRTPTKTEQFLANDKRHVVPVGPRFQAILPDFIGPSYKKSGSSKWLSTKIWPIESLLVPKTVLRNGKTIVATTVGRGRAEGCKCRIPGSFKCIKKHILKEKIKIHIELGFAFNEWKFYDSGEDASSSWTSKERQIVESLVEIDSMKKKSFLDHALQSLPDKKRENIISYYFDIIVPRLISRKIRSGLSPLEINTDNEEDVESSSSSNHPRKMSKTKSELGKKRYLTGVW